MQMLRLSSDQHTEDILIVRVKGLVPLEKAKLTPADFADPQDRVVVVVEHRITLTNQRRRGRLGQLYPPPLHDSRVRADRFRPLSPSTEP